VDYDKTDMPEGYDKARAFEPGMLDLWLDRIAARLDGVKIAGIVDLGCGTGRFTAPLAERFGAGAIGVDPSERMLDVARGKQRSDRVTFLNGSAEAIPLPDASADLIFISLAFHHFSDRAKAVSEMHRVLRPQGRVCLRSPTAEQRSPFAPFFPGYQEIADRVLPSAKQIQTAFERGGFRMTAHDILAHKMAPSWLALADKAAIRADSILQRLPNVSFAEGVIAMRAQARTAPDEFVGMNIDLFVFAKA
jgi:ubiquinone/menaquinone biosynthesis C-methylase UbiE